MTRTVNEIIIHCSATKPGWFSGQPAAAKAREIKRWHVQENGWSDIGYHYVVDIDGTVVEGRPLTRAGAHTKGKNAHSIGICLIGGYGASADDSFSMHFTQAQDTALRAQIEKLREMFPAITKVSGHNEYANKGCPGFRVAGWYQQDAPPPKTLWDIIKELFNA